MNPQNPSALEPDSVAPQSNHACAGRLTVETSFHPAGWPDSGIADAFLVAPGKPAQAVAEFGENCLYTVRGLLGSSIANERMDANAGYACLVLMNLAIASFKAAGVDS